MKKILIILSLFLLACGNKEINKDNLKENNAIIEKNTTDSKVNIEKIDKIERVILDTKVDLLQFREELSKKLLENVQNLKEKALIEKFLKNPQLKVENEVDEYSIIIDDKLKTLDEFISFLKFAYSDNDVTLSLSEDESKSLISSILVDILEDEIKVKLNDLSVDHDFVASYLLPSNDFSQVEVYFGFSTFYFED